MKTPRLITSVLLLSLLVVLTVSFAHCSFGTTPLYDKFNSATPTFEQFDTNYTSISAQLTCHLTFNATTEGALAKIGFYNGSDANSNKGIFIYLYKTKVLDIYYCLGATDVKIGTDTVTNVTDPITIEQDSDDKISVSWEHADVTTTVLEGYICQNTWQYVGYGGVTDSATDGWFEIQVGGGFGDITSSMTNILPAIISLAMLGCALGMIKQFGR